MNVKLLKARRRGRAFRAETEVSRVILRHLGEITSLKGQVQKYDLLIRTVCKAFRDNLVSVFIFGFIFFLCIVKIPGKFHNLGNRNYDRKYHYISANQIHHFYYNVSV